MKTIYRLLIVAAISMISLSAAASVYSDLESRVNALSATSTFAIVVSVDKDVTAAIAANLITESQFETLDSKIRNIYRTSTAFEGMRFGYSNMPDASHSVRNSDCIIVWNNTISDCGCDATIKIPIGVTAVFIARDDSAPVTIKRNSTLWNAPLINVEGTLIIKGAPDAPIIIDGGAVIADGSYQDGCELSETGMTTAPSEQLIVVGKVNNAAVPAFRSTYATIQNNYSQSAGSGMFINGNYPNPNMSTMFLYNTSFINIWTIAPHSDVSIGSAMFVNGGVFNQETLPGGSKDNGILMNHCHFKGNLNSNQIRSGEGARLQNGGAAFAVQGGEMNLRLKNSLIESNYSPWHGGAIFWNLSSSGQIDLEGTTFERNCGGLGAALYVQGDLVLKNCTFRENKAVIQNKNNPGYVHPAFVSGNGYDGCGGALYIQPSCAGGQDASCNLTLQDCLFDGNEADLDGGAILIYAIYNVTEPSRRDIILKLDIKGNTIISNNKAGRMGGGVALTMSNELAANRSYYNIDAEITMQGGQLTGNEALGTFTNDRATFPGTGFGGALFVDESPLTINNGFKILSNTSKNDGGAIYVGHGNVDVNNAELSGNTASEGNGGAVCVGGGSVTFQNGVLKNNTAINGGGIYLAGGSDMTFTDGLITGNHAVVNSLSSAFTTVYKGGNTGDAIGCGGGIYLQSGTSAKNTTLDINVEESFGIYSNTADRAGDDIVAEGDYTVVTVPNVTSMDLKDFAGSVAQPNWYEDYVYIESGEIHDSEYSNHGFLRADNANSGKRFHQMQTDGSGEYFNHLISFDTPYYTFSSAENKGYVCLSLGYLVLNATVHVTGLNEDENMYFVLEQMKKVDSDNWVVNKTYKVLLDGTRNKISDGVVQRTVRNIMPGMYRVRQFKTDGNNPWAWSYIVTEPLSGEISKNLILDSAEENMFRFTVTRNDGGLLNDEKIKTNTLFEH